MASPYLSVHVSGASGSGGFDIDYTLSAGVWYFFAVVFDADANWADLYINGEWVAGQDIGHDYPDDGVLVVGDPMTDTPTVFPTLSTDDHMLTATSTTGTFEVQQADNGGPDGFGGSLPTPYSMTFDEVGVSTTTLYSPTDIKALWNDGHGLTWSTTFFDPWLNVRCVQGVTPNAPPVVGYNGLVPGPAT